MILWFLFSEYCLIIVFFYIFYKCSQQIFYNIFFGPHLIYIIECASNAYLEHRSVYFSLTRSINMFATNIERLKANGMCTILCHKLGNLDNKILLSSCCINGRFIPIQLMFFFWKSYVTLLKGAFYVFCYWYISEFVYNWRSTIKFKINPFLT